MFSLGSRAVDDDDDYGSHNPAIVSYLPFSDVTFACITDRFFVHGSIARVINRGFAALFSRAYLNMGEPSVPAISISSYASQQRLCCSHFLSL
jgi:hypothetical protein